MGRDYVMLKFFVLFIHSVPSESIIYQKDKLWPCVKQYPLLKAQFKGIKSVIKELEKPGIILKRKFTLLFIHTSSKEGR